MRNLMSYGIALAIILVVALWMSTGTFVQGGRGPGAEEGAHAAGRAQAQPTEQQRQ